MGKAVIGLDIGTSSVKAVVYNLKEGVICSEKTDFPEEISNGKTMNPEGVVSIAIKLLSNVIRKNKGFEIKAIGMSTLFPSLVALDNNGKPLTKVLTWMDDCASSIVNDFKKNQKQAINLYKKTGCVIHESYPLWKILWLKKHKKNIFLKTDKFVSLSEYLTYRFTGKFVLSKAIASTTGFFNIHSLEWDDSILSMIDITKEKLSKCCSSFYSEKVLNGFASKTGLTNETVLVLGAGDGLLCNVGSGSIKERVMTSTIGTSGALRLISNKPVITNPSIWCYYLDDKKWVFGSAINAGWSSLKWFKKSLIASEYSLKELDALAINSSIDGAIFLPFLDGERGNGYNQNMSASFIGLSSKDDIVTIYRSILEGIFFNMYSCYETIVNEAGTPSQIRASGWYTNSDFMMQMQADIFNQEISIPIVKEASAVGAAIIALKSIGDISTISEIEIDIEKTIYPDLKKHNKYMKRYKIYKEAYAFLTKIK